MTADLSGHSDSRHNLGVGDDQADGDGGPGGHAVCQYRDLQIPFLEGWCKCVEHCSFDTGTKEENKIAFMRHVSTTRQEER